MPSTRAYELVKELDHPRAEVRRAAADDLVAIGAPAEPALTELLQRSKDLKVRRRILLILGAIEAPKAIPSLMEYILDRPSLGVDDTRALAMQAILHSLQPKHRKHCFDVFVQLRRDGDPLVRGAAIEGLCALGDARATRFLEEVARNDEDDAVRESARRCLSSFRVIRVSGEFSKVDPVYSKEDLVFKLGSRDAFQREMAIGELLTQDDAFEIFADAASSIHALARKSGIMGLGELGDARALEQLLGVAGESQCEADERALALRALARIERPEHFDIAALLEELRPHIAQREDIFRMAAALGVLATIPLPDARDILTESLHDKEAWIRESAAGALAENCSVSDKLLLEPIAGALRGSGERCQAIRDASGTWPEDEFAFAEKLLEAANRIAEPGGVDELDIISTVVRYLAHPRADARNAAVDFIQTVANGPGALGVADIRAVLEMLSSRNERTRNAAIDILELTLPDGASFAAPRLASLIYHDDRKLVRRVIPLLARTGDPDAQNALSQLANDIRDDIASAAREALLRYSGGELQ